MNLYLQVFLACFVCPILGILSWRAFRPSSAVPLPPGPRGDPIIGHVRVVPDSRPEMSYAKWAKEYKSDVIYVKFMAQPVVILNSAQAASDLLERRGNIYSDRPDFNFFEEMGWRDVLTFTSMGPAFRKHRKMLQNAFMPKNCIPYRPRQEELARELVRNLMGNPSEWEHLFVKFATSVVLGIAYGVRVTDNNDGYYVQLAAKVAWTFANGGSPGATFVDIMPIVRRLPSWVKLIPSLNFARKYYTLIREMYETPFAAVKKDMANGNPPVSFVRKMLEEKEHANSDNEFGAADLTEEEIKGAAATIYAAGADTTLDTMMIFVLNMVRNPKVQQKAQQELDTVVGRDRLPDLSDRGNLPYLDKVFSEVARWHPVVPLGVPHKSSKDDVYNNMFIPKGSLVMGNAYAIGHDSSVYADPDNFNPDRYTAVAEGGLGEPVSVGHFGFGRRACPGQHLGSASVWIVMATIVSTLKISKALDSNGNEITPNPKMTTGLESHPEPFKCVFTARDKQAAKLLEMAI